MQDEPPEHFCCPIGMALMSDPVFLVQVCLLCPGVPQVSGTCSMSSRSWSRVLLSLFVCTCRRAIHMRGPTLSATWRGRTGRLLRAFV